MRFATSGARGATIASPNLKKFVDPLPVPPVINAMNGGTYTIRAGQSTSYSFHQQLGPAKTWGYGGAPYLGPTFEAKKDVPVTITWENNLPGTFIPNDPTIMGAVLPGDGPAPIAPHLHGGFSLPQFDGTPLQWFTASGTKGPHYITNQFVYGNQQRATMLWYHDHALGNTRTNVYAGLAALYFLRDEYDTGKADNPLKLPAGTYEVPLVLQDKTFNADGTLFYPSVGETAYHPNWVPEFFGDTAVVNGKAYPFLNVEPRRYRFRIVNGSQARLYNLKLASIGGNFQLPFTVIGSEGGLLRAPVPATSFLIAPGERVDIIVDFAAQPKTTQWVLKNDARAPDPDGQGGDVPHLMQFNVNLPLKGTDTTTPGANLALPTLETLPAGSVTRQLHLEEILDPLTGNPIVLHLEDAAYLGNNGLPTVTTVPTAGTVEDWLLVNTTGDTHPIHLHLVHFEVIDRRRFNAAAFVPGGPITYTSPAVPAPAWENGLKDTVKARPGEVTRIRARFSIPTYGQVVLPQNVGVTRPQYVWHCHILEHEENDMMRAFEVA